MLRIAWNSIDGRLNRNTCSGTEVPPVQCARGLSCCFCLVFVELGFLGIDYASILWEMSYSSKVDMRFENVAIGTFQETDHLYLIGLCKLFIFAMCVCICVFVSFSSIPLYIAALTLMH